MRFIDTNIFIRFLAGDDTQKTEACYELFRRLSVGLETATTSESVLTEIAYVLSSSKLYRISPSEIAARLRPLLLARGLQLPDKQIYLRALDLYSSRPSIGLEDALTVAHFELDGLEAIYSYDRDFDRIPGIVRVEP